MRALSAGSDRREGRGKYHCVRAVEPLRRRVSSFTARARGPRGVQGDDHAGQLHASQDSACERQVAVLRMSLLLLHPRLLNVARHMPLQEDAPSNREVAGLGEFAPVHEARTVLETREEAVRLNAHDGIRAPHRVHPETANLQTGLVLRSDQRAARSGVAVCVHSLCGW